MQCGAKMNMVTFSAFEKQICNILHFICESPETAKWKI